MEGTFKLANYDEKYEYIKTIRDILNGIEKLLNTETCQKNMFIESVLQGLYDQIERLDEVYLCPFLEVDDFNEERILDYLNLYNNYEEVEEDFYKIYNNYKNGLINKDDNDYKMLKTLLNELERNEFLERVGNVRDKRKQIQSLFIIKNDLNKDFHLLDDNLNELD